MHRRGGGRIEFPRDQMPKIFYDALKMEGSGR